MKKFLLTSLITSMLMMNSLITYAGIVQVIGQGSTEEGAIHNAMRRAIEREIGIFIDNRTYTQNYKLISNDIYTKSSGFIESYEILRKNQSNGIFEIEIRANVRSDKLETDLMSSLQKKSIIDINMNDPRIAVVAFDDSGNEYVNVENDIIAGFKSQGFSRLIDIHQLNLSMKMRLRNATNDASLRNALSNQFHIDYLVVANIKIVEGDRISTTVSTRMIGVNTGEIVQAGTYTGKTRMFTANTVDSALKTATNQAVQALSKAALEKAVQVEQHMTILVTKNTLTNLGGVKKINERIKNLIGVNNVFTRSVNNNIVELDVNFDGTTPELVNILEQNGINIIEMNSEFIKI